MEFLRNLSKNKKQEARNFFDETYEENKKNMSAKNAFENAKNELQKFISRELLDKRE